MEYLWKVYVNVSESNRRHVTRYTEAYRPIRSSLEVAHMRSYMILALLMIISQKLRGMVGKMKSCAYEKVRGVSVACDCHQSGPSHMSHHNGDTQA